MNIDEFLEALRELMPAASARPRSLDNNFRCEACTRCQNCRFCRECDTCESCTYCEQCRQCERCTQCKRSESCSDSNYLEDCRGCTQSSYLLLCIDCRDCVHCLGCVGLDGAEFCLLNRQLTRKEYFAALREIKAHWLAMLSDGELPEWWNPQGSEVPEARGGTRGYEDESPATRYEKPHTREDARRNGMSARSDSRAVSGTSREMRPDAPARSQFNSSRSPRELEDRQPARELGRPRSMPNDFDERGPTARPRSRSYLRTPQVVGARDSGREESRAPAGERRLTSPSRAVEANEPYHDEDELDARNGIASYDFRSPPRGGRVEQAESAVRGPRSQPRGSRELEPSLRPTRSYSRPISRSQTVRRDDEFEPSTVSTAVPAPRSPMPQRSSGHERGTTPSNSYRASVPARAYPDAHSSAYQEGDYDSPPRGRNSYAPPQPPPLPRRRDPVENLPVDSRHPVAERPARSPSRWLRPSEDLPKLLPERASDRAREQYEGFRGPAGSVAPEDEVDELGLDEPIPGATPERNSLVRALLPPRRRS